MWDFKHKTQFDLILKDHSGIGGGQILGINGEASEASLDHISPQLSQSCLESWVQAANGCAGPGCGVRVFFPIYRVKRVLW